VLIFDNVKGGQECKKNADNDMIFLPSLKL
jgi:hypothetical protein